jgi:hypothetical protein
MMKPTHSYSLMSSATSRPRYGPWTRAWWTSDLTAEGAFRLKQFGEQTGPEILERGYPILSKTLESEAFAEHVIEGGADHQKYGSAETELIRKAVEAERDRLKSFQRTSATTESGKELQRGLGGSGTYIDATVEQVAPNASGDARPEEEQAKLSNFGTSTANTRTSINCSRCSSDR